MKRLINTSAMTAAMIVIAHGLYQNYGVLAIAKRTGITYVAAFAIVSVLVMVFRHGIQDDWILEDNRRREVEAKRKREARLAEEEARLAEQLRRKEEKAALQQTSSV